MWAGFHAVPSCEPLHLHLISSDLSGASLKNLRHYRSFASSFFVPLSQVRAAVATLKTGAGEALGARLPRRDAFDAHVNAPVLACHRCGDTSVAPTTKSGQQWDAFREHLRTCVGATQPIF
jgi:hypothetical protein